MAAEDTIIQITDILKAKYNAHKEFLEREHEKNERMHHLYI